MKRSLFLLCFVSSFGYGQMDQYNYKMELEGITDTWHKISLPNTVFEAVDNSLYDLRIFGITANKDTIETPYLLKRKTKKTENTVLTFKQLNESYSQNNYYVTFEVPSEQAVNRIELDFDQKNFDWKLKLEGSQDNREWFTIADDYRILSIENSLSSYQFTKISFPDSKYQFYRISIDAPEKPRLNRATLDLQKSTAAGFRNYEVRTLETFQSRQTKKTTLEITLVSPVPASYLSLDVANSFDYYRPITIQYLTDSIKTEQGWKSNYQTLKNTTLSSLEKEGFTFNSTILQKLKVVITNYDNEPLKVKSLKVKGYEHELAARFSEPATYFLTYGKSNPVRSNYDIAKFENTIPKQMTRLTLKEVQTIEKQPTEKTEPLFKNKLWLWAIMGLIILVLGWFSIKMLRQ